MDSNLRSPQRAWASAEPSELVDVSRCLWMAHTNSRPRDYAGGGAPAKVPARATALSLRRATESVAVLYSAVVSGIIGRHPLGGGLRRGVGRASR